MQLTGYLIGLVAAYIAGSFPTGVLVGQLFGVDVRKKGSGNPGATNLLRTAGKVAGLIGLLGDAGKGYLVVYLAAHYGFVAPAWFGVAAVLGHCFPPSAEKDEEGKKVFPGGKGVATMLGVGLAISPLAIGLSLVVFVICVATWRFVSLGSIAGAILFPAFVAICVPSLTHVSVIACNALLAIVIYKHSENIGRLLAGTERKIGEKA